MDKYLVVWGVVVPVDGFVVIGVVVVPVAVVNGTVGKGVDAVTALVGEVFVVVGGMVVVVEGVVVDIGHAEDKMLKNVKTIVLLEEFC